MATIEDLARQIVALSDQARLLQAQVNTQNFRQGGQEPSQPNGGRGLLFDKKLFEPEKFERTANFKEWTEDFADWVMQSDETIGELLNFAREAQQVITQTGADEETQKKGLVLYRALKKLVTQPEAKAIITHVAGKNPYEAWRQMFSRFDPRNDSTASAIIMKLMSAKEWKCKTLAELPVSIAKWEALQRDHRHLCLVKQGIV